MNQWKQLWKRGRRKVAGFLAVTLLVSGISIPVPALGSDIWPQKSTAPFYCLDGGKGWKASDRYEIYKYDTLPAALTEIQAKRLFWAYPSNWNALKSAAAKYDTDLYAEIASTVSGPNVVKRIKDDKNTKFAWVADNPDVEARAIHVLELMSAENSVMGNEAPEEIRDATSEETAVSFTVLPFSGGPGALDTEFKLGSDFVRDIVKIEAQSVWDNGSIGGNVGWLDASQDKNIAKAVMGEDLYEVTWSGDSIKIHNNGSALANENAVGSEMSEEEKYNKTTVRYKITMRENSGWYTEGSWNEDYLREWMDFKACVNAPGQQRLYKADIRIVPSDVVFYMVINQDGSGDVESAPEYGGGSADVPFQVYRHEESFESNYNVKLKKLDDETGMPLKGSQFYLYERFEDAEELSEEEEDGALVAERLNFSVWDGFQIFAEGTTDENGEIEHSDIRNYVYSKTYCDGHGIPDWVDVEECEEESEEENEEANEESKDQNREAAKQWMEMLESCESEEQDGTHFHWLVDDAIYAEVQEVLESGVPSGDDFSSGADQETAFEQSGCKADCELTYEKFINLRFSYTWKEVQARSGYILHGVHEDDMPIEIITTNASEAGAESENTGGNSDEIEENIWYSGNNEMGRRVLLDMLDDEWEEAEGELSVGLANVQSDHIRHIVAGDTGNFSHSETTVSGRDYWIVRDHRTEGEIHINKRDMDLYREEAEDYSSYGDTEGDGTLEGAVYGLFAAEDILHPDTDLLADGIFSNTGYVYRKNDLVSVAVTDQDGNASFMTYTVKPGMTYNYESGEVETREDIEWIGPENCYEENQMIHGNWWIGRPLILGKYYVKELSRSEGYELSINGKSKEWTNYGETYDTPEAIAEAKGTVVFSMDELSASMDGEEAGGNGYDQLTFRITSVQTTNSSVGSTGYEIVASGFPEGTEFFRVDSGVQDVTGPHVTGVENVVVRDENGDVVWKTADSDTSHVKYEPEFDQEGNIIGQVPMSRVEPQILKYEQVPEIRTMELEDWNVDMTSEFWNEKVRESSLEEKGEIFGFLKTEVEGILNRNGYEVPVTADGKRSQMEELVYSVGVKKGQEDIHGMTTDAGEPAIKTVYGAAVKELLVEDMDEDTTIYELFSEIINWYCENPQWSFGGVHEITVTEDECIVTLYAGVSTSGNRRFFTMTEEDGERVVDCVYAVHENPKTLRWEYQEYDNDGVYEYEISRQYFYGSGNAKRYYIDVTLTPAMMVNEEGVLQMIEHRVMVYHEKGEEIVDYLSGDPENEYKVPKTELVDKIEITTDQEIVEQDVLLDQILYDSATKTYRIQVESSGVDSFGEMFSDEDKSLELSFVAKLPQQKVVLTDEDILLLGNANVHGYQAGDEIGYAEYLMRFGESSIGVNVGGESALNDTYIVSKQLVYHGQHKVSEDGNTKKVPVQTLERPIKQKIKVTKRIENEDGVENFRFKIYLKSNLERLYCDDTGKITWIDRNGDIVDIQNYKSTFPELVQKIYTKETGHRILETVKKLVVDSEGNKEKTEVYNYEKFFDAIRTANTDKWDQDGEEVWNTSWKPFAAGLFSKVQNEINTSWEAKENAKRSDAVRQFAVTWYLEENIKPDTVTYVDEVYDKALYAAILQAETYLAPFFEYDLDEIYAILWDSEENGGVDFDFSTLAADEAVLENGAVSSTYGISEYLPYGDYVLAEQQLYKAEWFDFENRHYEIDSPKEIRLPLYYGDDGEVMESLEVPWSVTEPGVKEELSGYADQTIVNRRYRVKLRVEKLDKETGEPILYDNAVFAFYKAERNEAADGDGSVKRYEKDTLISGSKQFLEAMGATDIVSFARNVQDGDEVGVGSLYSGVVPVGTPICSEGQCVIFHTGKDRKTTLSTVTDLEDVDTIQVTGYLETPEELETGVYVLAELKSPAGYVRSKPIPVEIYSDAVKYYPDGKEEPAVAIIYGDKIKEEDAIMDTGTETARIYVNDTATSLEVSKKKVSDTYRSMKVSGRVEGSITALGIVYGLENLELAYNSAGTYMGFGWKKGTLEYLENRRESGERVELVYENGVFQGYGYVTRTLETASHENRYVAGATMALYEAIEIRPSGDSEDYAYEGIEVTRDRNGNVVSIVVNEEYAGGRGETPVLFYDLSGLKVLQETEEGDLYGYDKNGQRVKITFDTKSVYAIQNGKVQFEITGGDLGKLVYNSNEKAFTEIDENTVIYHLDQDLCRDAQVDAYSGLAYVEKSGKSPLGREEGHIYVWPVSEIRNESGKIVLREKILSGRAGEKNAGTELAYTTGTFNGEIDSFEKLLNPSYDRYGMVENYPASDKTYKKGESVYDRDGEFIGYQCEDLLKLYNMACYGVLDPVSLYGVGNPEDISDDVPLYHREGEAWMIPNIWTTGGKTPQDPENTEMTLGQEDLLRRVIPGTYIMEELQAPAGYVRALPVAVCVEETADIQRVSMNDEKIKVEISKVEGTDQYKKEVVSNEDGMKEWSVEATGTYTGQFISGAKLALYKADRIYTSDYSKYPKGYYFVKAENTPACWNVESPVDNQSVQIEALWTTEEKPKYFEGIPAGDYILEEVETPEGYLPASMELTVKAVSELQSFILKNDHTKLEIYKYEEVEGEKVPLSWPDEAEFALYPAFVDSDGQVLKDDRGYRHGETPIAVWKTGGLAEYSEEISAEYEKLFAMYGDNFSEFAWQKGQNEDVQWVHMKLLETRSLGKGERVTQIWESEDHSKMRVTVVDTDGRSQGRTYEYQFDYEDSADPGILNLASYNTRTGLHRLDRIPAGVYILMETTVPDGYESAEPMVIEVKETEAVQRFEIENKKTEEPEPKGKLIIQKVDETNEDKMLSGAWFEVKNLQNGEMYRVETNDAGEAILEDIPVKGVYESGILGPCLYQVREIQAPAGYQMDRSIKTIRITDKGLDEIIYCLYIKNRETEFAFSKSNFNTNHFVEGASLAIYEARLENGVYEPVGDAVTSWISSDSPHKVKGILSGGKTYILVEEKAPDGYVIAAPVRFTISEDGKRITEMSENLTQVSILYDDATNEISSISVVGRFGTESGYRFVNSDNDIVVIEEYLRFSDGNETILNRERFRAENGNENELDKKGRYPIGTEYMFRNAEGVRIDKWNVTVDIPTHIMENERDQDGNLRITLGQTYFLEETVVFSDGSRVLVGKMSVQIDDEGNVTVANIMDMETVLKIKKTDITTGEELPGAVLSIKDENGIILEKWISSKEDHVISGVLIPGEKYVLSEVIPADGYGYAEEIEFVLDETGAVEKILMEDRPTQVEIRKVDITTGKELPGAKLVLKDSAGEIVDQWVSDRTPHIIRGKLIAGESYTLQEIAAPSGYWPAEEISFTVSMDGNVDVVVMEDHRKEQPVSKEEPEEPDEPVQPEIPIVNDSREYGRITAVYEARLSRNGELRLEYLKNVKMTTGPETGDQPIPWATVMGLLLSLTGCLVLCWPRRNEHE